MNLDLSLACKAAEDAASAAERVIDEFVQRGDWRVTLKQDDSPVTEVDVACEHRIKQVLLQALPQAAFYGEETGVQAPLAATSVESGYEQESGEFPALAACRWLVDPIDGTKSFIRGMPFYSTQIALEVNGMLCVGVSNAPAYGERIVAIAGDATRLNGVQVYCSDVRRLEDAFLSSGNIGSLAANRADWARYAELVGGVRRVRGYGDFCHYHQLCCGQTDLVVESDVNILDIAALTVAVQAAGGIMTDLIGEPITDRSTSVLAASTLELHQRALELLAVECIPAVGAA